MANETTVQMGILEANMRSLRNKLVDILEINSVYIQPPSNISMTYPAVIISLDSDSVWMADNLKYLNRNRYQLLLIDSNPLSALYDKLKELDYCSFNRAYKADNLNHFVFTIYY